VWTLETSSLILGVVLHYSFYKSCRAKFTSAIFYKLLSWYGATLLTFTITLLINYYIYYGLCMHVCLSDEVVVYVIRQYLT